MIIEVEDYLAHYGIIRKSGRYPWGSGDNGLQGHKSFIDYVNELKKQGVPEVDIAKGLEITVAELRAQKSIAVNAVKQDKIDMVRRMADHGYSNLGISKETGIPEPTVRSLLKQAMANRENKISNVAAMLREEVDKYGYVDVGSGVEKLPHIGISDTRLKTALTHLRADGYEVINVQVDQLGTAPGNKTLVKVLAKPGTTYKEVAQNKDKIHTLVKYTEDQGGSFLGIDPPVVLKSSRLKINYAEDGGSKADGVIFVRPGVKDLSMGNANYAQVRIAVDGTHYIKGMAVYRDDLPHGVDVVFNTNKSNTGNKLDALKKLNDDPSNPFKAIVRQIKNDVDEKGQPKVSSVMNIVNEQGEDWATWSKTISSQMLSKQSPKLAKDLLDETYRQKKEALDEILALTNPAVRVKLLEAYADGTDAAATHLKAAHFPRQSTHVILPISSLKDTEVYAPTFDNGERVVLIRFPHGGKFEIPELVVNNNNREGKKIIGADSVDAVGINHKVAKRLSGADFDGDTVLVIPNNSGRIKTEPALADLKKFDPGDYKLPDGEVFQGNKQQLMGDVSNLITDMTIKGASTKELAQAVKHSMVVIDAEKHNLDYKKSARDNQIALLKTRYQGGPRAGASTIVSRKKREISIPDRKPRSAKNGGPIDKATGKLVFEETGATTIDRKGRVKPKTIRVNQLSLVKDANELSSGQPIEKIYADHSNRLKDLANTARKEMVNTKPTPISNTAKSVYADQVASLNAKLNDAIQNRPKERAAQLLANAKVDAIRRANPDMEKKELDKVKYLALTTERARLDAHKPKVRITPLEWEAIQAGAISNSKLKEILDNADMDLVKQLATPRQTPTISRQDQTRARAMQAAGHTLSEIAGALGVSVSTLNQMLGGNNG